MVKVKLKDYQKFFILESIPGWVNMTIILMLVLDVILMASLLPVFHRTFFNNIIIYSVVILPFLTFILRKFKLVNFDSISIDKLETIMIFTLPIIVMATSFGLMIGAMSEEDENIVLIVLLLQLSNFLIIFVPFVINKRKIIKLFFIVPTSVIIAAYFWNFRVKVIIWNIVNNLLKNNYIDASINMNVFVWLLINLFILYLLLCDSKKQVKTRNL